MIGCLKNSEAYFQTVTIVIKKSIMLDGVVAELQFIDPHATENNKE